MARNIVDVVRNLKLRFKTQSSKGRRAKANCGSRTLRMDGLERRDMMSVSQLWFSGNTLVVKTDDASTSVNVSQVGSNIRISEVGTNKTWDYATSKVGRVEFQGGAGNDRFVNYVANLPVTAFGFGGNDYLEGYNGADQLIGGDGNDTLVGYGGDDYMWGGNGNDVIRGMAGNDRMQGDAGDDQIDGGDGDDILWGGTGNDLLLGGNGNDQLVGDDGNDQLNGQAGIDKQWGGNGNDVLISIDGAFGEYNEGGNGADVIWLDRVGNSRDNVVGNTSADMVQEVASFANGADRTLNGDRIADPTTLPGHTYKTFANNPLFSSSGPSMNDITQGQLADCYFLAGMGGIARDNAHAIRQNIVDFNDGTYGVRLGNSFYRVDNDLPVLTANGTTPAYAGLGAQNSMWVAILEKAFAHYRTGANSYASIQWGSGHEANKAFRSASAGQKSFASYGNATAMANDIAARVAGGQAVSLGFINVNSSKKAAADGSGLVMNHQYTVASVNRNAAGQIVSFTLRNPWGGSGAYVTVTAAQIFAHNGVVDYGRV